MDNTRVYKMSFASVYPHYINKVERKGHTKAELDTIISWLTGYNQQALQQQIDDKVSFETFFEAAPQFHPNATKITGVICGYRIEHIEDELMRKIRYLDKLVDLGVLEKRTISGSHYYLNMELYRILSE